LDLFEKNPIPGLKQPWAPTCERFQRNTNSSFYTVSTAIGSVH
jgi:hypothetical protein